MFRPPHSILFIITVFNIIFYVMIVSQGVDSQCVRVWRKTH